MKVDLQDVLFLVGVTAIVGGIGLWSVAAALVVFGVICLLLMFQIEQSKKSKEGAVTHGSAHK